ncbi:hypothetical protein CRM22_004947 [Opisthorchis felineus]|uniref:Uncharacterized protein n=1 Tax=Opisthorchis felineus TaxID=147828 RepID=A0A4S2LTN1_OPIFE|nr:hypothetical protein CRM22_004947 [Opisthorchis felineus]
MEKNIAAEHVNTLDTFSANPNAQATIALAPSLVKSAEDPFQSTHDQDDPQDKPPSPLSLQQGGGVGLLQSPPFGMDNLLASGSEGAAADTSLKDHTLADISDDYSEMDESPAQASVPLATTVWVTDAELEHDTRLTKQTSVVDSCINGLNDTQTKGVKQSAFGDCSATPPDATQSSRPVRKSVQELYGQPSWWGDGEDSYSYPHTSMLSPKANSKTSPKKTAPEPASEPCTEPTSVSVSQSERPRAESFVIAFGPSKAAGDLPSSTSGSLSQCIPDRLRRGFDERERERQQEKLRRQAANEASKPVTAKLTRGQSLKTTRAANATTSNGTAARVVTSARGSRPVSGTLRNDSRIVKSAGPTRGALTTTATSKIPASRPTTGSYVPRCAQTVTGRTAAARRTMTASSSPVSPVSKQPISCISIGVTPSVTSTPVTKWRSNMADTPRSSVTSRGDRKPSESATEPPSLSSARTLGRRGPGPVTNPGTVRRTVPASQSRPSLQSVPLVSIPQTTRRGIATTSTSVGAPTVSQKSSVRAPVKGASANRVGPENTRRFMSATASSGAKRVTINETLNNRHSQSPSAVPNSAKKPVTSMKLRRPPSNSANATTTMPFSRAHPRRQTFPSGSEITALVMATIDSYEDPKEYLLYRMLQGTDLTEAAPSTDDVFRSFRSRSPSLSKPRVTVVNIDPDSDLALTSKPVNLNGISQRVQQHSPSAVDGSKTRKEYPDLTQQFPSSTTGQAAALQNNSCSENVPAVDPKATQPMLSSTSPVQQRRLFKSAMEDCLPESTADPLSSSMLVSSSITSLAPSCAGTYILDANETLASKGLLGNFASDISAQVGSVPRLPSITEPDSLTPRGSPVEMFDVTRSHGTETDYQQMSMSSIDQRPRSVAKTSMEPVTLAKIQERAQKSHTMEEHSNAAFGHCPSFRPSANVDSHNSLSNTFGRHLNASTSSWVEACKDDMEFDRTEAPLTSCSEAFDGEMLVRASITSLAPSCAATYVLDVDETLAAQGHLPAIVQSREDLLSPTERRKLLGRSRSEDCTTTTKTCSANNGQDVLWDVLETEECVEDVGLSGFDGQLSHTQQVVDQYQNKFIPGRTAKLRANEDVDAFRLLPQPVCSQLPIEIDSSRTDFEARLQRMSGTPTPLGHDTPGTGSWRQRQSNIVISRSTRPSDSLSTYVGTTQPNGGDPAPLNVQLPTSAPPVPRDNAMFRQTPIRPGYAPVALKRPERSSSTSDSSPSTSLSVPSGTNRQEAPGEYVPTSSPIVKPDHPSSTFVHPLADIHDCYRALQDSVNFLIQSHSGPLPLGETDQSEQFEYGSLPNPTRQSDYRAGGLHYTQQPLLVAHPPVQRVPLAAVWPSEISCLIDESRRLLSKRHRLDGRQRSTASLDSALEKYEEAVAEPVQTDRGSLRYRRSVITAIQQHSFLSEKPHEVRTGLVNPNLLAAGDNDARKVSTCRSLEKSAVQDAINFGTSFNAYHAANGCHLTSRTGSSSVPEPASPTNSSLLQSVPRDMWTHDQSDHGVPFSYGTETFTRTRVGQPSRNRVRTVSGDKNILYNDPNVHIPCHPVLNRATPNDPVMADQVIGGPQEIDSRTFTRRKNTPKPIPVVDSEAYNAWITSISAISQGIDSLTKTSLLRSQSGKEFTSIDHRSPLTAHCLPEKTTSELPDSTTGPAVNELVRSAFVTPMPLRSVARNPGVQRLSGPHNPPYNLGGTAEAFDQTYKTEMDTSETSGVPASFRTELGDSNDSAMYYSLMVDSIRQLSFKLRECSDRLVRQVSSQQSNVTVQARADGRGSRTSSTDSVPTSTKYALNDALENMHTINEQLKIVDKLLFSTQPISRSRSDDSYQRQTSLPMRDHFQFVPLDQDRHISSGQQARPTTDAHVATSGPTDTTTRTTNKSVGRLAPSNNAPKATSPSKPAEPSAKWEQSRQSDVPTQKVQYSPVCSGAPTNAINEEDEEYY